MRMLVFLIGLVAGAQASAGDLATERYADEQLQVAREFLQRAHNAAQAGEHSLAGALAWQAALDARLAVGMTGSAEVRLGASAVASEAQRLVRGIASAAP
jgi:hypothetical protein